MPGLTKLVSVTRPCGGVFPPSVWDGVSFALIPGTVSPANFRNRSAVWASAGCCERAAILEDR